MHRYSEKRYWDEYWKDEDRDEIIFYFSDLVDKYIDWSQVGNYMEVGGAPGSIMAYMNKAHFIEVSTIDFSDKNLTESFLKRQDIRDYRIYQEDFEKIEIKKHYKKYDLVASWGFIEHFSKKTCSKFIMYHKKMVSDGGYLIIELPNIRKICFALYFLFNRRLLKVHNRSVMDLRYLKEQILKGNEFELLYAGYYLTMNQQNDYFRKHPKIESICRRIIGRFSKKHLNDKVKSWCFPYMILIAKKK